MMRMTPPPTAGEVVRGWTNIDLSRKGEGEAERLAKNLKGRGLPGIFSSDLDRALETAQIIEKVGGIPLIGTTRTLRTWGLGELEGDPLVDSMKIIRDFVVNRPNDKPKGGESFNQFVRRVLSEIRMLQDIYAPKGFPVGLLTHHWVIEVAIAWIESGAKPDFSMDKRNLFLQGQEPPGSVHDIWQEESGNKLRIKRIDVTNGNYHFKPGPVLIRHASTAWNVGGKG